MTQNRIKRNEEPPAPLSEREERKMVKRIKGSPQVIADNLDVSTSGYGILVQQLFQWRASIYRLIWVDLVIWLIIYYILNFVYRFALNRTAKTYFENLVEQVGEWTGKIPVTFLLGFFVSTVASRWWNIYTNIPRMSGPSAVLVGSIQSAINPNDAAKVRVTIVRYLNLAWVLALWNICGALSERFDIVKSLVTRFQSDIELTEDNKIKFLPQSGETNFDALMQLSEEQVTDPVRRSLERLVILNRDPIVRKMFGRMVTRSEMAVFLRRSQKVNGKYEPEWFIPLYWALATAEEALEIGLIRDNRFLLKVQEEIYAWSGKIRVLINYARRGLPLVYTQVVIIAVYTVFLSTTLSRQLLDPKEALARKSKGYYADYFIPILAIVHMVFMVGWFKVALVLMDPFGVDEEDFPFSTIFNSNMRVSKDQCSRNVSWYPKKVRPTFEALRQKNPKELDSEGPDSDDDMFKSLVTTSSSEASRRNEMNGIFTLDDSGDN